MTPCTYVGPPSGDIRLFIVDPVPNISRRVESSVGRLNEFRTRYGYAVFALANGLVIP